MTPTSTQPSAQRLARSEYKYHVPCDLIAPIESWISRYCVRDHWAGQQEWVPIRTLYLDNWDLRLFRDTKEGLPFRFKLRVRGYGDLSGSVKLEVKRKLAGLIVKSSTLVPARELPNLDSGRLYELGASAVHEFLHFAEASQSVPVVLVSYERKAFSSFVDDYVRITFDRRIQGQPMREWDMKGNPKAWVPLDQAPSFGERTSPCVMELKFLNSPPAWLRDLVLNFQLERRGFSKYCEAVERTVLGNENFFDCCPALWGAA